MSISYSNSANHPFAVIDVSERRGQYVNSFCITKRGTWLISVTVGNDPRSVTYTRRSLDRGRTWEGRVEVYTPPDRDPAKTIEMGQLLPLPDPIDGRERIYQFHIKHDRVYTRFGRITYTVSHDDGLTWEGPGGPGTLYDLKAPTYKLAPEGFGWHLMAPAVTLSNGECLLPLNVSTDPLPLAKIRSELVFATSSNIFTAKDPADVRFEFFPEPPRGVKVPLEAVRGASLGQEPQVVELSDNRLFASCRTGNGCIYYTVSDDFGRTWRKSQPLRYREDGDIMLHPNCPCPLAKLSGGRYAQLFCNNDGTAFGGADPYDHMKNRQPVYVAMGRETGSKDGQPLEFSEPKLLCSLEGFQPEARWRDLTYGYFLEDQGEYYHFYNAVWRFIQVNRVDPALVEGNGR